MGDGATNVLDRFTAKVDRSGDCWVWTACRIQTGYGRFWLDGHLRAAHRVAYELFVGPIPERFDIDHLCKIRACVRPDHLEPVSRAENIRRSDLGWYHRNRHKTHCPQGHPYDVANTRIRRSGRRACRTCDRERQRVRGV